MTDTPPEDPTRHEKIRDLDRLQEIFDLDLASARRDPALEDMLREAAEQLDVPVALVSIVLDDVQYFAASHGIGGWMKEARGTPIEWSFCTNVVVSGEEFVVHDAVQHPKVRHIPLVEEEDVRSYAGVPLRTVKGQVVGSFCVIGDRPNHFSDDDLKALRQLAERAMARIETRRRRKA